MVSKPYRPKSMGPSDGPITRLSYLAYSVLSMRLGNWFIWLNSSQIKFKFLRSEIRLKLEAAPRPYTRTDITQALCPPDWRIGVVLVTENKCNFQSPVRSAQIHRRRVQAICRYSIKSFFALLFRPICSKFHNLLMQHFIWLAIAIEQHLMPSPKCLLVHCIQTVCCRQYLRNNCYHRKHVGS